MDKLDLLGVRYDSEMELRMKYELAEEVFNYWNSLCNKGFSDIKNFKENCLVSISFRLKTDNIYADETIEIWNIIEKEFMNNGDDDYVNEAVITYADDGEYELKFNEYEITNSYSIIDNIELGHKIGQIICDKHSNEIIRDDNEYDIETINELIYEECLNDICIKIQGHVEEYLNNYLELE